jgi:hypothetical protein
MLGLVMAVEGFIARHDLDFANSWALSWRQSGWAAQHRAPACDVLCFGDSLVKCGVLPRVLEQRVGKPAYNLALPGCPAPISYFLLRRSLQAGARPSAIVVDFIPYLLAPDAWHPSGLRLDGATLWECFDLARATRDPDLFTLNMIRRALPSLRARFEIRDAIVGMVKGQEKNTRGNLLIFLRNWQMNEGAHVVSREPLERPAPNDLLALLWKDEPILFPDSWQIDPLNDQYVRRFIALAGAHNIPVYWLLPPMRRGVQDLREQKGTELAYIHFVLAKRKQFPNLRVIDARCSSYLDDAFADTMHLDPGSAAMMTNDLADVLLRQREIRAAPGTMLSWVSLPMYHEQPPTVPVEDMNQSRIAVRLRAGGRLQ